MMTSFKTASVWVGIGNIQRVQRPTTARTRAGERKDLVVLDLPGGLLSHRLIHGLFHLLDSIRIRVGVLGGGGGDTKVDVPNLGLSVCPHVPLGIGGTPQELNERVSGRIVQRRRKRG